MDIAEEGRSVRRGSHHAPFLHFIFGGLILQQINVSQARFTADHRRLGLSGADENCGSIERPARGRSRVRDAEKILIFCRMASSGVPGRGKHSGLINSTSHSRSDRGQGILSMWYTAGAVTTSAWHRSRVGLGTAQQDSVCRFGGSGAHGRLGGSEISARESSEASPIVGLAESDHRASSSVHSAAVISVAVNFRQLHPYWDVLREILYNGT